MNNEEINYGEAESFDHRIITERMMARVIDETATNEERRRVFDALEHNDELKTIFDECMYRRIFEEEILGEFWKSNPLFASNMTGIFGLSLDDDEARTAACPQPDDADDFPPDAADDSPHYDTVRNFINCMATDEEAADDEFLAGYDAQARFEKTVIHTDDADDADDEFLAYHKARSANPVISDDDDDEFLAYHKAHSANPVIRDAADDEFPARRDAQARSAKTVIRVADADIDAVNEPKRPSVKR
ncbi:MAG: hypothetical protein LBJ23_03970 [Tannerella sp.]|jgi:hypothetical protein|nr:hypothetical protein [Tannerella sp.]